MVSLKHLTLTALAATTSAQTANSTIRYMPFGDSITEIICWRAKLWNKLQSTEWGTSAVNFVGSGKTENSCKDTKYDRDNEGHSGFLAVDIASKNQLDGWLKTNPADVVTMHLGTNDIVRGKKSVVEILGAFTKLIATMRAHNAGMKIVVAQIIPMGQASYNPQIQALNTAIIPWAQGLNTTASPIWVVDQYTGFSGTADLRDGVHPNDAGDVKMANVWFPAVVRAFEAARAEKGGRAVRFTA
ncbi:carbohydrate esterase family 3 protein [Cucurbitaria berberidis CBS 394.84]|uniref:Carbohydrate esterase family 3 protein n=1 Tax=Cucurbitaria berberidis CBS 394.84 TaxID=1168544 RepID=A0A9P4L6L0_9PLEO|nr:carbohydrate esterase family 3 protein [Cucurbitaria berberidis CBS 394.84]KAF1843173.1 carbohydrate esterase family 3 protein [Cucurbitaria berberidis CBS 394.84]